jgi:hypothetical protein
MSMINEKMDPSGLSIGLDESFVSGPVFEPEAPASLETGALHQLCKGDALPLSYRPIYDSKD